MLGCVPKKGKALFLQAGLRSQKGNSYMLGCVPKKARLCSYMLGCVPYNARLSSYMLGWFLMPMPDCDPLRASLAQMTGARLSVCQ